MRFFAVLVALVMVLAGQSFPRVVPTTLRELTDSAKLIVIGYVKSAGTAGSYTIEDGATPVGAFREPTGFRQTITAIVGSSPFWQVSWSGRGQMPLRNVRNAKYVTFWTGDVQLPPEMSTISGPQREYSSFIRSVPLSQMLDFIQREVGANLRNSRAQHDRP